MSYSAIKSNEHRRLQGGRRGAVVLTHERLNDEYVALRELPLDPLILIEEAPGHVVGTAGAIVIVQPNPRARRIKLVSLCPSGFRREDRDFTRLCEIEHSRVADELRDRGVIRSANNPTGDLAEYLFCKAFGWTQAGNSHPAADATGTDGLLYQIKARRITKRNPSRQAGAMRALDKGGFHMLAGVLFDARYSVIRAAIVPHALVLSDSTYVPHTNSWKFHLRDAVWAWPGILDATDALRSVDL